MRTYIRNPQTPKSPLVKIKDVCRLCMSVDTNMQDIFNFTENSSSASLVSKILVCLSIEVKNHEWFPTRLCGGCLKSVEAFAEFRERCQLINEKLEYFYKKSANLKIEIASPALSSPPLIGQTLNRSDAVQDCAEGLKDSDTGITVHPIFDCSNLFIDNESHLCSVLNDLDHKNNARVIDLQDCPEEMSNHVLPVSERCGNVLDVPINLETSTKVDFEEVSDIDESGDAVEVQVSMNGDSYVIEVLEEMRERNVELSGSDVDASLTETNVPSVKEGTNSSGKSRISYCTYCKIDFDNSTDLKNHMQQHGKGVSCEFCNKWFSCKSALQRHEKTHSGEKPYKCMHCARPFSQKEILRRHLFTHFGDKPYKCSLCSKSYTQKEALKMHIRNNHLPRKFTEISQYQCSLCDKSFCHLSGLSRHQQTHAGKKYTCDVCGRIFTDQSCLRRHHLRLHLNGKSSGEKAS